MLPLTTNVGIPPPTAPAAYLLDMHRHPFNITNHQPRPCSISGATSAQAGQDPSVLQCLQHHPSQYWLYEVPKRPLKPAWRATNADQRWHQVTIFETSTIIVPETFLCCPSHQRHEAPVKPSCHTGHLGCCPADQRQLNMRLQLQPPHQNAPAGPHPMLLSDAIQS